MNTLKVLAAGAALLLIPVGQVFAAGYWTYSYQDFDVVAAGGGGGGRALALAHDVVRFQEALTQILSSPHRQLPTHIYELPRKELKALIGDASSAYRFDGYETYVVSDSKTDDRDRDWGALFGYTGSYLLSSGGFTRYPFWFLTGVPLVFANTQFEVEHVQTGGVQGGYGRELTSAKLIPIRTFLRLRGDDPQLQSPAFHQMFYAESWYLAREVLVESKLHPQFEQYWRLIQDGTSEEDAFSASFKLSYEDLDKLLRSALTEPTHLYIVKAPRPLENSAARQLSSAEIDAHLAHLSLQFDRHADALRFASQALEKDAANELALRTLAMEKLRGGDFNAALSAIDRLDALPSLGAAALTDSGEVLSLLASRVSAGHASLALDAAALRGRAKTAFERAIGTDSEYLRAWADLANFYTSPSAAADARALVVRAQPIMEKHSYSGPLARALAAMCARTGQAQCAFLFGEFWKSDAVTEQDLDRATAFLSRLQTAKLQAPGIEAPAAQAH